MLGIFDDANNYFELGFKNAGYTAAGTQFTTSEFNLAGTFTDDPIVGPQVSNSGIVRIVKTNGVITFSTLIPGSYPADFATLDNTATGVQGQIYQYLSNLDGKHIGFVTAANGSGVVDTVSFDYLRTSLNILAPATVTGRIALEGVSDLSAISPNAPLGVFDIQIRPVGSTAPSYEFKNVTLTASAGSAFGTYSVSAPAGTYDVWIKGSKNLAVLVPNVVVGASSGTVSNVILPAADANGDNSVDTSDFGVLVGGYNGDSAIPGSGYDPAADFNFDGVVDTSDFALLVGQYNNTGAN